MKQDWCYFKIGDVKVKIDAEDLGRVSQHTWRIRKRADSEKLSIITSVRLPEGVRNISLGQFLMKPRAGKLVYPRRYFESFDYRKGNLIVCTMQERQRMLPKKRKNASSRFRGVSYVQKKKNWRATIRIDAKSMNLGDFKTEEAAAAAYNKASLKYFGERGYQNIISRDKKDRRN